MHELSLAQAMVEQLEDILAAQEVRPSRIEIIRLEIGGMSGVDRDAFEFVFPAVAEGTCAEGATLEFTAVPLSVRCRQCGLQTEPEYPMVFCVACKSSDVVVLRGRDFRIMSMEVS